jgi:hypothetical protein
MGRSGVLSLVVSCPSLGREDRIILNRCHHDHGYYDASAKCPKIQAQLTTDNGPRTLAKFDEFRKENTFNNQKQGVKHGRED